jgi:hypothetical protein
MHDAGALKKRHSRCTIACSQERQASARRVLRYEPCAARITHCSPTALPLNKSGGRQPAVVCYKNAVPQQSTHCQPTMRPRNRSGGHQPAVGSEIALATATGFCGWITFAPRIRLPHHGWLTPAAPDARRRCTGKNDIRGTQSHVPKSGAHQPAVLWKSRLRGRFGTQSRDTSRAIKSGGHQPAVVCYKNAVPQESTHY